MPWSDYPVTSYSATFNVGRCLPLPFSLVVPRYDPWNRLGKHYTEILHLQIRCIFIHVQVNVFVGNTIDLLMHFFSKELLFLWNSVILLSNAEEIPKISEVFNREVNMNNDALNSNIRCFKIRKIWHIFQVLLRYLNHLQYYSKYQIKLHSKFYKFRWFSHKIQ